jgi:Lrp/AsnC family transcriptional regulator, leucine-responsive regulatory protein
MAMAEKNSTVKIDDIDTQILKILMVDARTNQKEIAEKCKITPAAVLRRIQKLKSNGVIVGTRILFDEEVIGNPYNATVLIDAANTFEVKVKQAVRNLENVIVCAESIGRYNLCSLIVVHDLTALNRTVSNIKNMKGVNSVSVNIWTGKRSIDFARDLEATGSQL